MVSGTGHGYSLHGADLVMSCKYDGDIELNSMMWYHDGSTNALTETNDVVIVNGCYNDNILRSTLMIKSPTFNSNNGPYTCTVSVTGASTLNHVVSSSVRTARISDGNSASISQVTATSSELTVTCVVEGEVAPSIVNWFKVNGNTLQPITVQGENKVNIYKTSLVLKQMQRNATYVFIYCLKSNFSAESPIVTTGTNSKTYSISATFSNVVESTYQCYPHFNDGNSPIVSFTVIVGSIHGETCNFATIGESATLTCHLTASSAATAITFTHSEAAVSLL